MVGAAMFGAAMVDAIMQFPESFRQGGFCASTNRAPALIPIEREPHAINHMRDANHRGRFSQVSEFGLVHKTVCDIQ
jgi:hypothetical protein